MQRVDDDARTSQFLRQVDGEHDLRQLALAVSPPAAEAAHQHDVVEIERLLSGRADVDDTRRRAGLDQRQEQTRQQEPGEIVHRETQFVAVGAGLP